MSAVLDTERLRLQTMGPDFLRASLAGDRTRAERMLDATLPEDWPDLPDVLSLRLRQLEAQPDWEPWLTRAIVLRDAGRIVGITGYHGPPGGEWLAALAPGGVELGYTVYTPWRRRGIATEASRALIDWAVETADVRLFALSMSPANDASRGVARKLGFRRVGSWRHETRGLEEVYRLSRMAMLTVPERAAAS